MWNHYSFRRTTKGNKEWGIVSADSPDSALQRVLGSPTHPDISYAMVYIPDENGNKDPNSDFSREYVKDDNDY